MIILHDSDEHAPFAHFLVAIPERTIVTKDPKSRKKKLGTIPATEYVVCYFCGHWVNRPIPASKCNCPASCHAEALAARE